MNVESFSNLDVEIIHTRLCGEMFVTGSHPLFAFEHCIRTGIERERQRETRH